MHERRFEPARRTIAGLPHGRGVTAGRQRVQDQGQSTHRGQHSGGGELDLLAGPDGVHDPGAAGGPEADRWPGAGTRSVPGRGVDSRSAVGARNDDRVGRAFVDRLLEAVLEGVLDGEPGLGLACPRSHERRAGATDHQLAAGERRGECHQVACPNDIDPDRPGRDCFDVAARERLAGVSRHAAANRRASTFASTRRRGGVTFLVAFFATFLLTFFATFLVTFLAAFLVAFLAVFAVVFFAAAFAAAFFAAPGTPALLRVRGGIRPPLEIADSGPVGTADRLDLLRPEETATFIERR